MFVSVCDALPNIENAEFIYSTPVFKEGNYVNGTTVTYTCNDNNSQNGKDIVCGVDGTWSGKVECIPGKKNHCISFFNAFCNFCSSLTFIKIHQVFSFLNDFNKLL